MKKLLIAAIAMMASMTAHAELWAVAGNNFEGFFYLYDDRDKSCPKDYPLKLRVVTTDGTEHRACYAMNVPFVMIYNPEAKKSGPLPLTLFTSTPYGDRFVMRLP